MFEEWNENLAAYLFCFIVINYWLLIRFVFRRTVVEHVKPRPHWATLHAVVDVFSDYSRRFSRRKRRLPMVAENCDMIAKIVAVFAT